MSRQATACLCLLLACCSSLGAQVCAPNEILLKNDVLPAVPSGATPVGLVPGLCDSQAVTVGQLQGCFPGGTVTPAYGEALVCVFDVSTWTSVQVTTAAVMAAHATGSPGLTFVVNLEFYDGIVAVPGGYVLGNQLFDLGSATGNNAQLTTHAINTIDVSPYNITTTGNTLVMALRMEFNLNGNCATVFGTSAGFSCDLGPASPPGKNFVHGIDICSGSPLPTLLDMSTLPGAIFQGNWIARVCVVPGTPVNPLQVHFVPSNVASPGSAAFVNFVATPAMAGDTYVAVPSLTLSPPGFPVPIPVTTDFLALAFLSGDPFISPLFVNFVGTIPPSGTGAGLVNVPLLPPSLLPLDIHVAFATFAPGGLTGISDAGTLTVQ